MSRKFSRMTQKRLEFSKTEKTAQQKTQPSTSGIILTFLSIFVFLYITSLKREYTVANENNY